LPDLQLISFHSRQDDRLVINTLHSCIAQPNAGVGQAVRKVPHPAIPCENRHL
jgi:hypothetical protein